VGGTDDLQLEIGRAEVRAGDRYLLCSDGLYGTVPTESIAAALALSEPEQACRELKAAALTSEARDNLTAVVVHVTRSDDPETMSPQR
jgi:serine/threonine protein phosphatase PrpC